MFIQLQEKASKSYPTTTALRKLGNSKKEKKAEAVTEKKGSKSKDKKKAELKLDPTES